MLAGTEKCLPLSLLPIFPLLATYDCCASGQACYSLTRAASQQVNWCHLSSCSALPSVAIVQLSAFELMQGYQWTLFSFMCFFSLISDNSNNSWFITQLLIVNLTSISHTSWLIPQSEKNGPPSPSGLCCHQPQQPGNGTLSLLATRHLS